MFEIIHALLEDPAFNSKVKYEIKHFKANEKILLQGKEHQKVYLIEKGTVRIIVNAEIREHSTVRPGIADLGPHDIFGEFGLFDDLPASADVMAVVDSELLEIDMPSFKVFLGANPDVAAKIYLAILKILVKRLRCADKTIFSLYTWGMKAHQLDKYLE